MWGIEFRKDTQNALICGTATFEVRKYPNKSTLYRLAFGPHGTTIMTQSADGWTTVKANATTEDIEAILPKNEDFGFDWTYQDFMVALTFFGDGYKLGEMHGFKSGRRTSNDTD